MKSTDHLPAFAVSLSDLVNPFTRVRGTLSSPAIQIDPTRSATQGGLLIATLGLSWVAQRAADRITTSGDMCAEALEEANPGFVERGRSYREKTNAYRR